MAVDVQPNPVLSVYELVQLFDDHPTAALIVAICDQVSPGSNRDLLHAMFQVPKAGPLPDGFAYRLTDEQGRCIDLGLSLWRKDRAA